MSFEKAIFAAGCFWGVEATYLQLQSAVTTQVGYTGGTTPNPTYKEVCTDKTGHAEAVEVTFDPSRISYEELVTIFFKMHDASQINRQGPDIGQQYRSAIFYHSQQQKEIAEKVKDRFQSEEYKSKKIMTEISPASTFYPAEEYHQQYFVKNGFHACVNYLPLPKKNRKKGILT